VTCGPGWWGISNEHQRIITIQGDNVVALQSQRHMHLGMHLNGRAGQMAHFNCVEKARAGDSALCTFQLRQF